MKETSKTGLSPSPVRKVIRYEQVKTVQIKAIAQPAPFVLKPFAGIYNPFSAGCSLLCNHPTDSNSKESLRKVRDNWVLEGKKYITDKSEEFSPSPRNAQLSQNQVDVCVPQVESVPEELFRRYTDTDSRPQTPTPTLASAATRASNSRRCVTPEPSSKQLREKTLLVLDLRRSHSQETISFHGNSSFPEPPLIQIQQAPTRSASLEDLRGEQTKNDRSLAVKRSVTKTPDIGKKIENANPSEKKEKHDQEYTEHESDEEFIKRRGKKKKKKGVNSSRGANIFQTSSDPETQVATIGAESHNPSARPSLAPDNYYPPQEQVFSQIEGNNIDHAASASLYKDSYLEADMLKQLRRELNEDIVDAELNYKRKMALVEAMKTITKGKPLCEELVGLQRELKVPAVNENLWIFLPRSFTRSSLIFGMPMDSRTLLTLSPMEYLKDNVQITSARKLLYKCIFDRFKIDSDDDNDNERRIAGKSLQSCLNLLMGKPLTPEQLDYFRNLIGWSDTDSLGFKSCCGIFAVCERILAPQFSPQLPDKKSDPCHEIEQADFASLQKKLCECQVNEKLKSILLAIHES